MKETATKHLCNSCRFLCKEGKGEWLIVEKCSWYRKGSQIGTLTQLKLFDDTKLYKYRQHSRIEF